MQGHTSIPLSRKVTVSISDRDDIISIHTYLVRLAIVDAQEHHKLPMRALFTIAHTQTREKKPARLCALCDSAHTQTRQSHAKRPLNLHK